MTFSELEMRVEKFRVERNVEFEDCLGAGTQGTVFVSKNPSQGLRLAVKFHHRAVAYFREVGVYFRLQDLGITHVCGHRIPIMIGCDDELLAIEMTIVSPPFCLDFGGAYLDRPPDYSPEVWEDWRQMKSEAFEGNWPKVESILTEFRSYGIYIADVNPGNIRFK